MLYYTSFFEVPDEVLVQVHHDYANVMVLLAVAKKNLDHHNEAIRLYQMAELILKHAYNHDHPAVASVNHNLATVYHLKNRFRKALQHYQKVARSICS